MRPVSERIDLGRCHHRHVSKIAGTQYEKVDDFVATAIKEMQKVRGTPKQKVESGKTGNGQPFFINEYPATKSYWQWGKGRLHSVTESRRLHRFLGERRTELSQIFARANRSVEILCLSRAQR